MSTREFVIKQIELLPEEALEQMKEFISFQRFNLGIYNKEIKKPICIDDLTDEQFDTEMQKGMDSINAGRIIPVEKVRERMKRRYEA